MGGEIKDIKIKKYPVEKDLEVQNSEKSNDIDITLKAIDSKKKEIKKARLQREKTKIIKKA